MSFDGSSARAAVPRAASLVMAFEDASLRQLVRLPVNARRRQPVGLGHARDRLAGGKAAVDVRTIEMLARVTSPHGPKLAHYGY